MATLQNHMFCGCSGYKSVAIFFTFSLVMLYIFLVTPGYNLGVYTFLSGYLINKTVPDHNKNITVTSVGKTNTLNSNDTLIKVSVMTLVPKKKEKIILYWNSFFGIQNWSFGFGHRPFESCKVKNCITTNDHEKYKNSDAMLCHMRSDGCGLNQLPKYRSPNQYWIYFLVESPVHSAADDALTQYNGLFNLTATYRRDSNIFASYSEKSTVIDEIKHHHKFYKGEETSMAWVASNCATPHVVQGRMVYAEELSKFFKVTRYGKCPGHISCGKACFVEAAKKHKFYFAAENSLCRDYITEKPWRALEVGMIPVVYGYGNYTQALPHNSFISVSDFDSPRLLAAYLNKVAEDETLYNSYFEWRKTYVHLTPREKYICKLCTLLNQPQPPKSIIKHLDKFWSQSKDCISPRIFHQSVMKT